jgi:parvulin-like peptidyl-prolyl isomerase
MARRVRSTQIDPKAEVTREDARKYYDEHTEMISTDLHIAALRFPDEEKARAALERIMGGAAFESVAREMHPHALPGKPSPWDMGFLHWNQIPAELTDAVYALRKGEVSGVLSGRRSGMFIVKLIDRKKNPEAAFERMSAAVMMRLRDLRAMQEYERYIEGLKKEAKITKHEERRKAS